MRRMIQTAGILIFLAVWGTLTAAAWFGTTGDVSISERRPLAQLPALRVDTLLSGEFMTSFEEYALDQFPLRDNFRKIKSLVHYYLFQQKDSNGIYIAQGHAAALAYPLDRDAVAHALDRFEKIYAQYLRDSGSDVYMAIVPDKGYYLAQESGYPSMDYHALFDMVADAMPWAEHINLTDRLHAEDYYFTDTHWRQERLFPVAQRIAEVMGVQSPQVEDFVRTPVQRPFYGVYYGQAALPMASETMYLMQNEALSACRVFSYEKQSYSAVYDMERLGGNDLYEIYLSGAQALLTVENPNAGTDRELIVFRDSFASSLIPLLSEQYSRITLVDIRYIRADRLAQHIDFHGQDVLFLYSTLVLNHGTSIL